MIHLKNELWEILFNSIDEGFCIIEMIFDEQKKPIDYRFLMTNAAFEKQTGLIAAEGKRMREFAPNHEEHWFEIYGKIALTGESVRFENRAEQLNRTYDVFAFRFGEPQDLQVAILFKDITERKHSEDTIKSLAAIVNSSDDAIFSISLEGKVKSWNKGAEKMFGYTFEEIYGKNISLIIPTEYIMEEKKMNERIRNNETIAQLETVRMKKNGDQFYISLSASPLKNQEESIIGISVIAQDVTERKKTEDSSKLKDAFLSLISHEIRTPLNAIMGFSNVLAKRKLGEDEKEYVNIIKSSGDDLLKIIDEIIDMSRIEAETLTFAESSFSPREVFESLNVLLLLKAQEKNLTLLFACDKDVPDTLHGDQKRLTQILINLINNAIIFSEKGNINVRAKVIKKENNITLLEFSVSDTGIGISLDNIKTIFDRFRQIEQYSKRKQGGMGLGLSIAKGLVDLQGGTMTVKSELKKGSVFTFCIPYKN